MRIALDDIRMIGGGLSRPECVLAHSSGLLIAPDWTDPGGVALIAPDGRMKRILATRPGPGVDLPIRPNGIALEDGGTILIGALSDRDMYLAEQIAARFSGTGLRVRVVPDARYCRWGLMVRIVSVCALAALR